MRRIYIGGKFHAQGRLKHERERIHREGLGVVVGTWLEQPFHDGASLPPDVDAARDYAVRDLSEVRAADLLIIDTQDDSNTGGREVELGHALACGIEVWRVGPYRNVFHQLTCAFESWDEVLDALWKEQTLRKEKTS